MCVMCDKRNLKQCPYDHCFSTCDRVKRKHYFQLKPFAFYACIRIRNDSLVAWRLITKRRSQYSRHSDDKTSIKREMIWQNRRTKLVRDNDSITSTNLELGCLECLPFGHTIGLASDKHLWNSFVVVMSARMNQLIFLNN